VQAVADAQADADAQAVAETGDLILSVSGMGSSPHQIGMFKKLKLKVVVYVFFETPRNSIGVMPPVFQTCDPAVPAPQCRRQQLTLHNINNNDNNRSINMQT